MKTRKERNSQLELIRIISMILIIMHHYSFHGNFNFNNDYLLINKIYLDIITLGGKLGVNIFILISGYFMINSNAKPKKALLLYLQVLFYSVVIYVFALIVGIKHFEITNIPETIFPISYSAYWFASIYIVLYVLSPYINLFIKAISNKELKKLLVILFVIWSVIPTFIVKCPAFSELPFFIMLYLISGYIRNNKIPTKTAVIVLISALLFTIAEIIITSILGIGMPFFQKLTRYFVPGNRLPILLASIAILIIAINAEEKNNKIINFFAKTVFGIYLIHDNSIIRQILWLHIFKISNYQNSNLLIFHSIASVIIVFVACSIVDFIRIISFEKLANYTIDKISVNQKHITDKLKLIIPKKLPIEHHQ